MNRSEIIGNIVAEAGRGTLTFPTSAKMALVIKQALDDPNCPAQEAVRLIRAEPLLSARVVALANAVAFNPSGLNESAEQLQSLTRALRLPV